MILKKNDLLELEIIDMNMMGLGVAKVDGAVVFVQNGVIGDKAQVRIIKCAKKYFVAKIEQLLVPSSWRIEPKCPHHRRCGGCSFQIISYEKELKIKENYVRSCLKKEGIEDVIVKNVLSTGNVSGYRNKAQFPLTLNGEGKVVCGFYSPKTHNVCPIESCDIQNPLFSKIANFVCRFLTEHGVSVYDENTEKGLVRHIFLRSGNTTGEVMLCLVLNDDSFPVTEEFVARVTDKFPEITSIVFNVNKEATNVVLGKESKTVWGKDKIETHLLEKKFSLSPHSFFQVNYEGAELLYSKAFELADINEHDLVLDIYCGIGSISLCSGVKAPIFGVEIVPEAVEDAKDNAKINKIENATFVCADAARAFDFIEDRNAQNPIVIVDPPRKGLSESLISDIAEKKIPKVLYISCGPDTLARDIARFRKAGYTTHFVQPVDMFPRTSHVESIAVLYRRDIEA